MEPVSQLGFLGDTLWLREPRKILFYSSNVLIPPNQISICESFRFLECLCCTFGVYFSNSMYPWHDIYIFCLLDRMITRVLFVILRLSTLWSFRSVDFWPRDPLSWLTVSTRVARWIAFSFSPATSLIFCFFYFLIEFEQVLYTDCMRWWQRTKQPPEIFLKISQNLQKNTYVGVSFFNKVAGSWLQLYFKRDSDIGIFL